MSGTLQKSWAENQITNNDTTNGWNFPRNFVGGGDPTSGDDETLGFWYGSIWVNYTTPIMFYCIDPTTGAAVWQALRNG